MKCIFDDRRACENECKGLNRETGDCKVLEGFSIFPMIVNELGWMRGSLEKF